MALLKVWVCVFGFKFEFIFTHISPLLGDIDFVFIASVANSRETQNYGL